MSWLNISRIFSRYILSPNPTCSAIQVCHASKTSGGISRNKRGRSKKNRRGIKVLDGDEVLRGRILCTQLQLKFYPGENVNIGRDFSLNAAVDGKVILTREVLNPYADSPIYPGVQSGEVIERLFFHVIPHPQHNRCVYPEMDHRSRKSTLNDNVQYNHSCFRCAARFPNSTLLLQHMREDHSSFVEHAKSRIPRNPISESKTKTTIEPINSSTARPDTDSGSYKNISALCPFCNQDCHTRKKLMRHLELEHKDDNDQEDENTQSKVIRLHETNGKTQPSSIAEQKAANLSGEREPTGVQNLLNSFASRNIPTAASSASSGASCKSEVRPAVKLQYKCFWCDASFRKRGKLMDHIDLYHKHNKQQSQAEAEMLNLDEPGKHAALSKANNVTATVETGTPPPLPNSWRSVANPPFEVDPQFYPPRKSCSFHIFGSLSKKNSSMKPKPEQKNLCKFYFGKIRYPSAGSDSYLEKAGFKAQNFRRYSLPNIQDAGSQSTLMFPYGMGFTPNSLANMPLQNHYNYMIGMRHSLLPHGFYHPHQQQMGLPPAGMTTSSATIVGQQFLSAAVNAGTSSVIDSSSKIEAPLDLTKN